MKKIILFITVLVGFNSCLKYEFDGFPDELLCWIPYNIGDSLLYTNDVDTIVFEVQDFFKTGYDSFRGLAMDVEWDYEGYYITNELENGYLISEKYSEDGSSNEDIFSIKLSDNDIFTFSFWEDYYTSENYYSSVSDSINISYVSDTVIGNMNYYEVYKLNKTSMKNSERIKWIIKAKDKGIIQFFDNKTKEEWRLIN
nr:hypothetical protein [uncultured Carboxylicivirga sp.]